MRLCKVLAQNECNVILAFSIGKSKSYVQIQNQVHHVHIGCALQWCRKHYAYKDK